MLYVEYKAQYDESAGYVDYQYEPEKLFHSQLPVNYPDVWVALHHQAGTIEVRAELQ